MSTTVINPSRVSPSIPPGVVTEIPALPTVPDPVNQVDEPVASALRIEQVQGASALPIEEVQAEAYRLYLERGGEDGHDVEDWLAAEALVRAKML